MLSDTERFNRLVLLLSILVGFNAVQFVLLFALVAR